MMGEEPDELRHETEKEGKRLKARWHLPENRATLERVVAALRTKQPWVHLLKNLPDVEDVYQGRDLRGAPLAGTDLTGADFQEAMLYFADLSGARLAGADLRGASLSNTDLSHADLRQANFTGNFLMNRINLAGADLTGAEMGYTTITKADLTGANLTDAYLGRAELIGVKMDGAILDGADTYNTSFREFATEGN